MECAMKLTGLIAATHTPFDASGELNLDAIPFQAAWLLEKKIHFAFICGSTGESHSLSLDERMKMAQRWASVAGGTNLKVIVHVGSNCLRDAAVLAEHAQSLKVEGIAALAPSYFKPASVSILIDSIAQIALKAPALPFYYYDIPSLTNVCLSMPQFLQEAPSRIPNLVGIKFSHEDYASLQSCLAADDGRWDMLWGVDECLLAAMALGIRGAVGSSYNFAPGLYQRLIAAFQAGDMATARQEQQNSVRLIRTVANFGYLPASKHVMELLGVPVGGARLPLTRLDAAQKKALQMELEQLDLLDGAPA
jgi:N-acetylneuraminate lyase